MSEEGVTFHLGAESSELVSAFKTATESLEELQHAAHTLEGAFAFEGIKDAFTEVLSASSNADNAERKFIVTMQATGQAADPDRMFAFAGGLAEVTTFSRDAGIEAGAMLARFHLSQDQIEAMLPSIADLAAYMRTDLVGASDMVGRAVMVGGRALQGLNLGFTKTERAAFDLSNQHQRLAMIQDKLNHSVAGMAEAMAQTATGGLAQLHKSVDELYKSFGHVVDAPVGGMLRALTADVNAINARFSNLGDNTKATLGAMASGLGAVGAGAAGLTTVAGALGVVSRVLPTLQAGFSTMGRAAAAALSGVLLPAAAIAAGLAGIVLIVGALKTAWDGNLGGMRDTLTAWGDGIMTMWQTMVKWLADQWDAFSSGISEKVILFTAMVRGISPEEAGAMVRASNQQGGGLFGDAVANLKTAFEFGKGIVTSAAGDLKKTFMTGADTLKAAAKAMGVDLDAIFGKLFGGAVHPEKEHDKIAASSNQRVDVNPASLKDIFAGQTAEQGKKMDQMLGQKLVDAFGGGDAGFKAAAAYMKDLVRMTGLSSETLTTILEQTHGDIGRTTEVGQALSQVSDSTAKLLLDIGHGNVADVMQTAAAVHGLADGVVQQVAKATGDSMAKIAAFGKSVGQLSADFGLSADTLAKLLQAIGGNVEGLGAIAKSVKNLTDGQLQGLTAAGVSIQGMQKISKSVDGLSEDLVNKIIAQTGSSADDIARIAPAFKGLSDSVITKLMEAAKDNVDKASQAAAFMKSGWGQAAGALQTFFGGLVAKAGDLGQIANGAMQGFKEGGPWGAVAGALLAIADKSASFVNVVSKLSTVISNLAQAFNPLFDVMGPVIDILKGVFQSFGAMLVTLFKGLQPVFAVIVQVMRVLGSVLSVVFNMIGSIVGSVMAIIAPIFKAIMPIIKIIGDLFSLIAPLLTQLFNAMNPLQPIIAMVSGIFTALKPVFDVLFQIMKYVGEGLMFAMKVVGTIWNAVIGFIAGVVIGFGDLLGPAGQGIVKFGEGLKKNEVDLSQFDKSISDASNLQQDSTDTFTSQADDTTDAVGTLGDSATATSESLTNAANGWKVSLDRFQSSVGGDQPGMATSTQAQTAAITAAAVAPAVRAQNYSQTGPTQTTNNQVTLTVQSNDPNAIYTALKAKMAQDNFQQTGTSNPTSSPFAVATTATNR